METQSNAEVQEVSQGQGVDVFNAPAPEPVSDTLPLEPSITQAPMGETPQSVQTEQGSEVAEQNVSEKEDPKSKLPNP